MKNNKGINYHRIFTLLVLIFAAEMVYSLPYHPWRFYRPTFLEVFNISNIELGDMFAVYGIIAALSYFPGGYLADKFSTRILLTTSLISTALGGLYLAQIPGPTGLTLLFGYWGLTSVLLFWAAMIKATREWGGPPHKEGRLVLWMVDGVLLRLFLEH